jgi:hypothetical protein
MKNTKRCELDFAGEKIFIGLDVHLKSWKVTIATTAKNSILVHALQFISAVAVCHNYLFGS